MSCIRCCALAALLAAAVLVPDAGAIPGYVFWSAVNNRRIYAVNIETGATTTVKSDIDYYGKPVVSPDGRQIAYCGHWTVNDGIGVVNTDGTRDSALVNRSINYGLGRNISFASNGVYFIECVGEWPNQSSKILKRADRATGAVSTIMDLSAINDGAQGIWMADDGRKGVAWIHSYTVTLNPNATYDGGTYRIMTGVWGHGPVVTSQGTKVVVNAINGQCDPAPLGDHHSWYVYDYATGVCGQNRTYYVSQAPSNTSTGDQMVVRGTDGDSYIAFGTDDGNAYLLHWSTGAVTLLPKPAGASGTMYCGDVFLGALPGGSTPVLSVTPSSLSFTSAGTQNVTVSNAGGGTLTNVSTSVSYASGSGWLAVARSGSGNTQTLANTVSTGSLANGSYTATVTVSGGGASNTVQYTVRLSLGAPSNLAASVSGARYRHVTLTWTDNITGETGFSIERSYNGGAYSVAGTAAAGGTSFTDSNVTCNNTSTYAYRVRASYSGGGWSPYSNVATVTVNCVDWIDVTAPAAGASFRTGDTIRIRWETGNVNLVAITGSYDGFDSTFQINPTGGVNPSMPTWGNYPWVASLPAGVDSSREVCVRVASYTDQSNVFDVTGMFTIRKAPTGVQASARESGAASGSLRPGLLHLPATGARGVVVQPGERVVARVLRLDGVLVHEAVFVSPGTHTLAPAMLRGAGMYLLDIRRSTP